MNTLGDSFSSALHKTHLKPQGFKKTRHTFSRFHESFAEHYQIQGSEWNAHNGPWTFYLNCGISFNGLPRRTPDRDFPHTHAWMRAPVFSTAAQPQYDVSMDNFAICAAQLAEVIWQCSEYFQRRHLFLRECYQERRYEMGFLADPELRNSKK